MAINGDIGFFYSGASGTSATSLGGAIHATEVVSATDENLFQDIDTPATGDDHYSCLYLKNEGTATYTNFGIYISTPTPSTETQVYIGIGLAGVNGTEQTITNQEDEPSGVLWTQRYFDFNAITVGTLAATQHYGIWFKMVHDDAAGGSAKDYFRVTLVGEEDTAPAVEVFATDFSTDFQ